jgi:hypothetical protein
VGQIKRLSWLSILVTLDTYVEAATLALAFVLTLALDLGMDAQYLFSIIESLVTLFIYSDDKSYNRVHYATSALIVECMADETAEALHGMYRLLITAEAV